MSYIKKKIFVFKPKHQIFVPKRNLFQTLFFIKSKINEGQILIFLYNDFGILLHN